MLCITSGNKINGGPCDEGEASTIDTAAKAKERADDQSKSWDPAQLTEQLMPN